MTTLAADTKRALRGSIPAGVSRAQRVALGALVLIAVSVAFRAWIVSGAWFYADDYQWLADVARGDAGIGWMFSAHDSQFMPLGLALAQLTGSAGVFVWPVAAAEMVILQAMAGIACWRMLSVLFGSRPEILVLLASYLFSVFTLPTVTWWAVSLNQLPLHIALFAGVTTHVLYLRTGKRRYVAWTSLWLTLGFLSYVKTLLIMFILVMIALLYFASGGVWARIGGCLRRYWTAWMAYAALTAAYLYVYVVYVPNPISGDGDVDYLALTDTLVRTSLGPGLLGGPWRWSDWSPPVLTADTPEALVTASWFVVIAAGLFLLVTRRRAWRVLLVFVPYLAVTIYLVGEGRAWVMGPVVGAEFRYLADVAALLPLVVGLAWLPLRGARETVERRATVPLVPRRGLLLTASAVLVAISATASSIPYALAWHDNWQTRAYVGNARQSLDDAPSPPRLADYGVPMDDLGGFLLFPYNQPKYFLAPVSDQFSTTVAGNDLSALDPSGHITDAGVSGGIQVPVEPNSGCGLLISERTRVPLGASTIDYQFWVEVGYITGADSTLRFEAGDNRVDVGIRRGLHTLLIRTDGVYDSVTFDPAPGATICVDRISIGNLEAR
ncbi:hypothetical protein [Mumia sp.]|uniref:hypothetical protein n=1 Tax=Mumia sp. TaxID=1965300 RepID=UPI0026196BD3|nr:hypothetical protein [Mumia sp.]MDD9350094.1 hypothetical protein [Mumia sp.]